ncbi:MAG TPA: PAS domain S-box protein [Candidatus Methylacidiphilales bacterium]
MKNQEDILKRAISVAKDRGLVVIKDVPAKTRKRNGLAATGNGVHPAGYNDEIIRHSASLFNLINDAIIARSMDGKITLWNPAAERMFGYSAAEIVGRSMKVLFPTDPFENEPHHAGGNGSDVPLYPFETIGLRKDGRPLDLAVTHTPLKNATGEIIGSSKILRDLTEFNQVKRQIEEQAALLEQTQDAILILDLDGRILFWNRAAERIYGWSRQEAVGRIASEFIYADTGKFREVTALTLKQSEWTGELRHFAKDRQELIIECRRSLLRDKDGRPKSVLSINTDVTEKRRIEMQFMRAQRMESLGILAGGIAHDLNNILTPIMLSIDVLKGTAADSQTRSILETIEISTRRGSEIVQQVLSFARGLEGQRIPIQPKYLLKDIEHIILDTFPKDVRLQLTLPHDIWAIIGDPTQVQQVMLNLCLNARDAMPNGGALTVRAENCIADEQYVAMNPQAKLGSYVSISVSDAGVGIAEELFDKIFEPFFSTKDVGKGTGLGLSSVKAIVKSHDGFINVYSELGRGTTFKIYFPAQPSVIDIYDETPKSPELPRGSGETVLVVDDEASILTITSETLQAFGYNVVTASNGAEAVAIYAEQRKKIAVILTDLSMPVMDGRATMYALLKINPKTRIIAMSGMDEVESIAKASSAGIKHFISKPYSAATLLKTLRAILQGA